MDLSDNNLTSMMRISIVNDKNEMRQLLSSSLCLLASEISLFSNNFRLYRLVCCHQAWKSVRRIIIPERSGREAESPCMHSSSTALLFFTKKVWSKNQYIIHSHLIYVFICFEELPPLHSSFSLLFCYALIEMLKHILMSQLNKRSPLLRTHRTHISWLNNPKLLHHSQCFVSENVWQSFSN